MTNLLEAKNLNLTIGRKKIIDNVSLKVNKGDFIILLGSNGCGKSSLLKLLYKKYLPESGEIIFDQLSLYKYKSKTFYKEFKFLNQNCSEALFMNMTILENYKLMTFGKKINQLKLGNYLAPFNQNLKAKLSQKVSSLSGGEQQALALALFTLNPPKLLLLDEHTSALDPSSTLNIIKLTDNIIKKHNITCIMSTHNLEIAKEYGNKIIALREGKIYAEIENKSSLDLNHMMQAYY
jgi:putative ABC transport system ATP-binding protein